MIVEKSSKKVHKNDSTRSESSISERLRLAILALGYNRIIDFIEVSGIKKSTLYAVLNNQTKDPGASLLEKFYQAGINLNWLVSGKGEILRKELSESSAEDRSGRSLRTYPQIEESGIIEKKIKDTMDSIVGLYQQLKELRFYASEVEKLPQEKQEMFHKMIRVLLQSMKEKEE